MPREGVFITIEALLHVRRTFLSAASAEHYGGSGSSSKSQLLIELIRFHPTAWLPPCVRARLRAQHDAAFEQSDPGQARRHRGPGRDPMSRPVPTVSPPARGSCEEAAPLPSARSR